LVVGAWLDLKNYC